VVSEPRYSYSAINDLASGDTGHFLFLDAWSVSLLASMLSQERMPWFWYNNQFPLTDAEIDDLDNKLSTAQDQLMHALVGMIMPVANGTIPQGTLVCDGSTHLRTDYPDLYDVLDSAFILDDDHFTVPDLRNAFVMGASAAHVVGDAGGSDQVTITEAQMPSHTHTNSPHVHSEIGAIDTLVNGGLEAPAASASAFPTTTGAAAIVIDPTGGGEPVTITPPFVALLYVVVAL